MTTLIDFLRDKPSPINDIYLQIATSCKIVSNKVKRMCLENLGKKKDIFGINVHGEQQQTLDIIANDIFIENLRRVKCVNAIISEEVADVIVVNNVENKSYIVTIDPLDGSSNIDANVNTGSIFGIYDKTNDKDCYLQEGNKLIGAGYCLYGSSTILVIALTDQVNGFILDEQIGEYILCYPDMKIPTVSKIYSVNSGNYDRWAPSVKKLVDTMTSSVLNKGNPYSLRYIGSMVADIHRTLLYGGLFMYPETDMIPKLRYLYEVAPMAYIIKKAGGLSYINGSCALNHKPKNIHERVPIFIGSPECIKLVQSFFI